MEIFSQASPNTGDVVGIHLPAAKKVGRVTHVFKAKEGRLEKERVCIDDCVDLTEVYDMKELVKRQFGLVGEKCMRVRLRHKLVSDEYAFDAFLNGEELMPLWSWWPRTRVSRQRCRASWPCIASSSRGARF